MTPLPDVTRVEVINHSRKIDRVSLGSGIGRVFGAWSEDIKVEFELQDNNRTLKIFISDRDDA